MNKPIYRILKTLFLSVLLSAVLAASSAAGEDPAYAAVGDSLFFGRYPQTREGTDLTPIEWTVLDVRDGKLLLLSKCGLDMKTYHENDDYVTWETCSLRAWLNSSFLETAFTPEEQAAILLTEVDNSAAQHYAGWKQPGGENTLDRIFLLSYGEANRYLDLVYHGAYSVKARMQPTAYAVQAGAWAMDEILTADRKITGWWLLRSPGSFRGQAACVNNGGSLSDCHFTSVTGCVRPALWLSSGMDAGQE
ncbi:MAG: hypothetical protein IKG87_10945 [Clostridia bacterium]|nr:hypothetical protein [Clostridia bacterium]